MENVSKNSVPPDLIDEYRRKAEYLIERGYIYIEEKDVDKIALRMYNKDKENKKGT